MKFWSNLLKKREVVVLLLLVLMIIGISLINPDFGKIDNLHGIIANALILILLSLGESFVIITKGIDVSVGAAMGFAAVCLGLSANSGASVPLASFVAISAGIFSGVLNGVGVAVFNVPPIIMTLGSMGVLRGLMPVLTGGSWVDSVPQSVKNIANVKILSIDAIIWATLIIVLLTFIILKMSKKARYVYPVGDNEEGAFLLGLPIKRTKFLAYVVSGCFAGLAAILFVSQLSFIPMQAGSGQEMRAIAASVLGGVSLAGGVGSPFGPLVGGLFLTSIDSMLIFLKIPAFWNDAVAGMILLVVVLFDFTIRKMVEKENKKQRMLGKSTSYHGSTPQTRKVMEEL
jgi:AI-2 transport system permease protein